MTSRLGKAHWLVTAALVVLSAKREYDAAGGGAVPTAGAHGTRPYSWWLLLMVTMGVRNS